MDNVKLTDECKELVGKLDFDLSSINQHFLSMPDITVIKKK